MNKKVIITQSENISPCQVLAEKITILADHSQTASYEVFIHDAHKDAGPPPHHHPWDESFFVIDGEIELECDGTTSTVTRGGFAHIPSGTVHSFRYTSPTAKILGITSNNGAADFFSDLDKECGDSPEMENILKVVARHDVSLIS